MNDRFPPDFTLTRADTCGHLERRYRYPMDEVRDKVTAIRALPEFNRTDWWLTFYLTGTKERLEHLASRLALLSAVNLGGADGGFLYPKLPVRAEPDDVTRLVSQVRELANAEAVEVIAVDVDTTSDVDRSNFVELARFE